MKTGRVNWYKLSTDFQIEDYINYIDLMEESIEKHKSEMLVRFESQVKEYGYDEDTAQEFFEHAYLDDYQSLDRTYNLILRKSLFITLYSFMETELKRLSTIIENKNLTNIKLNDLNHRGILRYLFYLEKVNNIEINITPEIRSAFKNYNELRNYFVHSNDTDITSRQYEKLKSLAGVTFYEYKFLDAKSEYKVEALEKTFNTNYLDIISHFFEELYLSLDNSGIMSP
ncbi:hypothetical protein [Sporosarcina beigongshangi]|uniref:hypothetical protein n=1 Tax=Sporosarcina beigongshangi TaxID=2782538 RepID=UPI001939A121|nr:hypothetical protein [Sporosarcina beigongshangi]